MTIKLECLNCGSTADSVMVRRPLWFNGYKDLPLCDPCGFEIAPTSAELIKDRTEVLVEYYKGQLPLP